MTRYRELFQLTLRCDFIPEQADQTLSVRPDAMTHQWLQELGVIGRMNPSGYRLLAPESLDLDEIIGETPDLKWKFHIISNDPVFRLKADYPLDRLGYFKFTDERSGTELDAAFVAQEEGSEILAVVDLSLAQIAAAAGTQSRVIRFPARKIPWKIFIINQTAQEFQELRLEGPSKALFMGPVPTQLPNGIAAVLFDSGDNHLALNPTSPIQLSLVGHSGNDISGSSTTLIDRLPNAQAENIQATEGDEKVHYYSSIYIYL